MSPRGGFCFRGGNGRIGLARERNAMGIAVGTARERTARSARGVPRRVNHTRGFSWKNRGHVRCGCCSAIAAEARCTSFVPGIVIGKRSSHIAWAPSMDFISVITPQIIVIGLVAFVLLVVTFVLVSIALGE